MLYISDLNKLKITKYNNRWNIYFKYDCQRYFLHLGYDKWDDEDMWILYKKNMLENGHYHCEELGTTGRDFNNFIEYTSKHKRPTLSEIDIEKFAKYLADNILNNKCEWEVVYENSNRNS